MKTQIIYDNEGFIISIRQGSPLPREPKGVPFLWVEIPEGKQIKSIDGIGVDVTVTPHELILEDIPKSELELLREQFAKQNIESAEQKQAIAELTEIVSMSMVK